MTTIDERLDETSQAPTNTTNDFEVNHTMISLGFKWDDERETWYNEDNVWMYQKAAAHLVESIHHLFLDLIAEAKPEKEPVRLYSNTIQAQINGEPYPVDQYNAGFNEGLERFENNLKQAINGGKK